MTRDWCRTNNKEFSGYASVNKGDCLARVLADLLICECSTNKSAPMSLISHVPSKLSWDCASKLCQIKNHQWHRAGL